MAKKIEFALPRDFSPPDDAEPGEEFDVLATIQLKKDGRACLVAIDEHRMPGYKEGDKEEPEEKYDGKRYSEAASEGMEGGY